MLIQAALSESFTLVCDFYYHANNCLSTKLIDYHRKLQLTVKQWMFAKCLPLVYSHLERYICAHFLYQGTFFLSEFLTRKKLVICYSC